MKKIKRDKIIKSILPFFFLSLTAIGYFALISLEKGPKTVPSKIKRPPGVDLLSVEFYNKPLTINLNGNLSPIHKTEIASEVTGSVVDLSDRLVKGGYFKKGELILTIDDSDYKTAVAQANAELYSIKLNVEKEMELAKQAKEDWKELGDGAPTDLALRKPQIKQVLSELKAYEASLDKAKRDLEKTKIRAPYDCMISSKSVSVGTLVTPGVSLFEIFNVDRAQIRLGISPEDAVFIDLPRSGKLMKKGKKIEISWMENRSLLKRDGYISRTEGEVDPETRYQYLVVTIDDPYGLKSRVAPVKIGQFVSVDIPGKMIEKSLLLPAGAISPDKKVLKVNEKNMIHFESVNVLRRMGKNVLVTGNLEKDSKVVISKLDFPVEGTMVKINGVKNGKE